MVVKILAVIAILALVYYIFFKKGPKKNSIVDNDESEMIECGSCKIYVSKDEAILSNGKYFCSKECLKKA